jgi:thiamine biosynthesis lipoprotein
MVIGTAVSIDVVDSDDPTFVDDLVAWFHRVDGVFSPYREDSVVTRIGHGDLSEAVSTAGDLVPDVLEVLHACEELRATTDGVFDPWSVEAPTGGMFDPSGYVKGWAVERAARMLEERGSRRFSINAGGDIVVRGLDASGGPWRIGLRHPHHAQAIAAVVRLAGPLAIATSGSYERGTHVLDPRDGLPANSIASATVIGPSLALADAFATTLYVMGIDGLAWLSLQEGYTGCVITHDLQMLSTDAFDAHLVA